MSRRSAVSGPGRRFEMMAAVTSIKDKVAVMAMDAAMAKALDLAPTGARGLGSSSPLVGSAGAEEEAQAGQRQEEVTWACAKRGHSTFRSPPGCA